MDYRSISFIINIHQPSVPSCKNLSSTGLEANLSGEALIKERFLRAIELNNQTGI